MAPGFVGGFPASAWGSLFQRYPELLLLLQLWVSQELERFFGVGSFKVFLLTHMILDALPVYGLDEDVLVAVLQPDLRSHTSEFVRRLIEATGKRCGDEAEKLLIREGSCAASGLGNSHRDMECSADFRWWREGSPVASTSWTACQERREGNLVRRTTSSGCQDRGEWSIKTSITCSARAGGRELSPEPSPSPDTCALGTRVARAAPSSSAAAADADALPSTSTAAVRGGPGCVPAPMPAEQEDAQQEPGQAVPGASAPRRGRACSRRRPRCTRKRKTSSSEDSAAPAKKLPRQ